MFQVYLMMHGDLQMSMQDQHFVKRKLNQQLKKEALSEEHLLSPLTQSRHLQLVRMQRI